MTPTLHADSLAALLDRGRAILQEQRARSLEEQFARSARQQQRDQAHWAACRAAMCRDLPPCLIQHSNIVYDLPEGWTGGVEVEGCWEQPPTQEHTLRLDCPDCAQVRRIYTCAGSGQWRPYGQWRVPTHEIRQGDDCRWVLSETYYHDWIRHDDLAAALAEAWEYRTQRYPQLLAECERLNAELDAVQADPCPEPKPLSAADQLLWAVERVVCGMVRPECLQDHDEEDR